MISVIIFCLKRRIFCLIKGSIPPVTAFRSVGPGSLSDRVFLIFMKTETEKLLRRNYKFFQNQLPILLRDKDKKNKFALIKNEEIVGIYDT